MTTRIIGTGSYVPEQIVTNNDLAQIVETNDEWIRSRTGIGERRIATTESTSYMAANAAMRALEQSGVKPEEIDLILLGTSSPDYCFPNGACEVQGMIGAVNAACYDISAACTGFVYALNTAHAFISSGIYKTALVIGSDVLSKLIDWTDRGTCVLFGDGAGAVVVKADETGILGINMHSDGTKGNVLTCGSRTNGNFLLGKKPELGYMTMDGQEVFKFAVRKVPECIKQVLDDAGVAAAEVRYFVIHQANYRIIESIAKRLKVSVDCFPVNMEHYGNTSGASVPLLLDEINRKGMLESGDKIVFSGFGAGLTWGATLLEW
ncbi:ketoacyl-ACP synthase III [Clostridiales bacterium TF09-2AC]|uniref:Beta-ketoacyl-[acyl-carrier-protein] synthase III n=1 Tax=Enterocloster hominis (ex Hitch et al. 2024) TaxID=1917870 RepID=A0ABV1CZR8_9FIRM|nr:3-oxoacyl-(acyl carrier protein) synthase III [Clostridiales bacterium 1_7_47FAA]RJW35760.1 ketoacyl-ACP synthase III [Clostridiales bacterium TF09-2AC]